MKVQQILLWMILGMWGNWGYAQPLPTIHRAFKGQINQQYAITMTVAQEGQALEATYYYHSYRKPIELYGTISRDGSIYLKTRGGNGDLMVLEVQHAWQRLEGHWRSGDQQQRLSLHLDAIYPADLQRPTPTIDQLKRFQEFLNYFQPCYKRPLEVHQGITNPISEEQMGKMIPYRLAKRYIMNQIDLPTEGGFDYFDIDEEQYRAYTHHYQSLGLVYQTQHYVGVLCRLYCDTGWEAYDVSFLLLFDHAGHLLDACKVGKALQLEGGNKQVISNWKAIFQPNGSIKVNAHRQQVYYEADTVKRREHRAVFYWYISERGILRREHLVTTSKKMNH